MFNESHAGGTLPRYFANRCCTIFGRARLLKSCLVGRLALARNRIGKFSEAAFGISVVVLLASGATLPILAGEAGCDELLPAQVFRNVQEKYASLASYSDDGCVAIASMDGNSIINFTARLAPKPFRNSHRYRRMHKSVSGVLSVGYPCTFVFSTPLSWGCETVISSRWPPSRRCSQS